jgi:hypothetical protein
MSSSPPHHCASSSLLIAEKIFTLLQRGPAPLTLDPSDLLANTGLDPATLGWGPGPVPLLALRGRVLVGGLPLAVTNRMWSLLVTRVHAFGEAWTVAAVGMALPALRGLARDLGGRSGEGRVDLDAEILGGFLTALAREQPNSPSIFPRLLRQARRGGLAWIGQQHGATQVRGGRAEPEECPAPPHLSHHPDHVLAELVAAGVITADDAALIGATRLESISTHDLATARGLTDAALRQRRLRAERRVVTYLRHHRGEHNDDNDPTSTQALSGVRSVRTRHAASLCRGVQLTTSPGSATVLTAGTRRASGRTAARLTSRSALPTSHTRSADTTRTVAVSAPPAGGTGPRQRQSLAGEGVAVGGRSQ